MFLGSVFARNEYLDAPSRDQSAATLVLSNQRLKCRLVEVSVGGFRVMVPRGNSWTGDRVARLETHDSKYKVQLVKQEARYEGLEITLERVEEPEADANLPTPQRWIVHGSRCCAIGLIAAIVYCVVAAPGGITHGPAHQITLQDLSNYWFNSWPTTTVSDHAPVSRTKPVHETGDESVEFPTISVALTKESRSAGTPPVTREQATTQRVDRKALIQAAIAAANAKQSRPLNSKTLPWLFSTGTTSTANSLRCRMCRLAEDDLQMFATGLKSLPTRAAADATSSLRESLLRLATAKTSPVEGFSNVRLIRSEDAEIIFRMADGEAELLRVLPVEIEEAAPARSPSASARHSAHR